MASCEMLFAVEVVVADTNVKYLANTPFNGECDGLILFMIRQELAVTIPSKVWRWSFVDIRM